MGLGAFDIRSHDHSLESAIAAPLFCDSNELPTHAAPPREAADDEPN